MMEIQYNSKVSNPENATSKPRKWALKAALLGAMGAGLLLGSVLIMGLVSERQSYRDEAAREVHKMWSGPQMIGTPTLRIPVAYNCSLDSKKVEKCDKGDLHLRPQKLESQTQTQAETRSKGLFEIPVYTAQTQMQVLFGTPDWKKLGIHPDKIEWDQAQIYIGFSDARGLMSAPLLTTAEGQEIPMDQSAKDEISGFVPQLKSLLMPIAGPVQPLQLRIEYRGSEELGLSALAGEAHLKMQSNWSSPAFGGQFLPDSRTISEQGFQADWKTMSLNHGASLAWIGGSEEHPHRLEVYTGAYSEGNPPSQGLVGFRQIQPVDEYLMTERAVKYAILFIGLTFVLGLFAEGMTGRNIHVLQYLLIGASLLVFYTLLLALSEQIPFVWAYWSATGAIALQVSLFVGKILSHLKAAILACLAVLSMYGGLFVLLRLEEMALLAGSLALFAILGGLMYLSTRIQWGDDNDGANTLS